ncbi:MAG TPA: RNA methyltransferase [Victivallales bacterium]|nr:RNA methyltransferase [Victivallales bacterium]
MITRNEIKLYKSLSSRQGRRKSDLCICEGLKCCLELFISRRDLIKRALCLQEFDRSDFSGLDFEYISEEQMKQISPVINPQGIIFVLKRPEYAKFAGFCGDPFLLLLDSIQDPGNLGTIIRTAKSAGLKRIFLSENSADPYSDKVIRAATAQQFAMEICTYDNLESFSDELLSMGCSKVFLSVVSGGADVFREPELFDRSAIVFGNEGSGISKNIRGIPVSIPMPGGTESLNVAQAATVILFDAVRRGIFKT